MTFVRQGVSGLAMIGLAVLSGAGCATASRSVPALPSPVMRHASESPSPRDTEVRETPTAESPSSAGSSSNPIAPEELEHTSTDELRAALAAELGRLNHCETAGDCRKLPVEIRCHNSYGHAGEDLTRLEQIWQRLGEENARPGGLCKEPCKLVALRCSSAGSCVEDPANEDQCPVEPDGLRRWGPDQAYQCLCTRHYRSGR